MQNQDVGTDRSQQVVTALLKFGAVVLGLVVAVLVASKIMVSALGLDTGDPTTAEDPPSSPAAPLPSTALPEPTPSEPVESSEPTELLTPRVEEGTIALRATPVIAGALERINLVGDYTGVGSAQLQVQRRRGGEWVDFPTSATVRDGEFETFIMTGQLGDNEFRVFDASADKASNTVKITVQ